MKTNLRFTQCLPALLMLASAPTGFAQSIYIVQKAQHFVQLSATGPTADPFSPFFFNTSSASSVTLTMPDGRTLPLATSAPDGTFNFLQAFATKAALDAAFPVGTYRMTGTGIPALSFSLTPETYPVAPQITSVSQGGWNSGGVLVVNPAQPVTLNFNTFTGYATVGAAGHMHAKIRGIDIAGTSDNVRLDVEIASRPFPGLPVQATPVTSLTIPAGTLTSGRLYLASVDFDTLPTFDLTTVPNGGLISIFSGVLDLIFAAQAPGTTTPAAPTITTQPASQTGSIGSTATFSFIAGGGTPTLLQWYFNGLEIDQSNVIKYTFNPNGSLTIRNLTTADAGTYAVALVNAGGIVTSVPATLTVSTATVGAPVITRQPVSVNVVQGTTAVFSVTATDGFTYEWRRLGGTLPASAAGANGPTLVLSNVQLSQIGSYNVVVGNSVANTTSATVSLSVLPGTNDPGRLSNLSILTPLAAGESMTMGTVLGGTGTTGSKPLLARAVGPSLAQLGVTGFLPDPTMTLVNTSASPSVTVATNNDWAGAAALNTAFAAVGAFPFVNATSKDAAIFQPALAPGNYTVQVGDAGTGSGTVIAELYDATPGGTFTAATPRLVNVSVLKQIATGTSLTVGFVIGGSTAKTVLIRAVGPTLGLAPFNVGGAMADPQLTLVNISASPALTVAANNDWGGDPGIAVTALRAGAFAIANASSKDAMLLITLPPGNYTAQVAPASSTAGGTAIVEVYEVP